MHLFSDKICYNFFENFISQKLKSKKKLEIYTTDWLKF